MIRPMLASDDAIAVAKLLYATDDFLFPFLFGNPIKAIPRLAQLVKRDHNAFSYHHIVLDIETEIRGLLLINDDLHDRLETQDFWNAFSIGALIRLMIRQFLLFPVLRHSVSHGRYIQNICVSPLLRGKGIGSNLLEDAISRAKEDKIAFLQLDVDIHNPGALRLYQKYGFKIIKAKRIWGLIPFTFAMEKSIE